MAATDDPKGMSGVGGSPAAGARIGDGGVPEAGGADLQPSVERIHRAIRREPRDPIEGREPTPWFFTAAVALALFWGGWYLGHYGGEFGLATHVAFAARQPGIAAAAAGQAEAAVDDPVTAGRNVYEKNCQGCHQGNGQGIAGAFPPLVGSEWVTGPAETLARILLHGLQGPVQVAGATYNGAMPAWKDVLKDGEIAAVATYIRQWKPNAAPPVPPELVASLRAAEASRTAAWTAQELTAAAASTPAGGEPTTGPSRTTTNPGQAGPTPVGPPATGPAPGREPPRRTP
jgi:mono/diheme cytochrome c family protein